MRAIKSGAVRRILAALCLAAAGGALAACGIPSDAQPATLSTGQLPPALRPSPSSPPVKAVNPPGTNSCARCLVRIYFISALSQRLIPVFRRLPRPLDKYSPVGRLQQVLNELDKGPTEQEGTNGIITWLSPPPGPQLSVINVQNGLVTIGLDAATTQFFGVQYQVAISQIVWTIDDPAYFPDVRAVSFQFAGSTYPVLLANGDLVTNPVTTKDFEQYAPASTGGSSSNGST